MTREYGKISGRFWTQGTGKAIRGNAEAQLVALYLMTCPTSEMTGVFQCPKLYIAHETGLGMEGACKGLQSLIDLEYCMYDDETETVFVYEMAKFQIGEELKVNDNQVKAVIKAYSSMAEPFKQAFYARYYEAFHLPDASPSEGPLKPRTRTRAETGARTGEETNTTPQAAEYSPEFEIAWKGYPERPGSNKKNAYKAWNARLKAGVDFVQMTLGVDRYAHYVTVMKIEPQFIKQPETFFGPAEHYLNDWKPSLPSSAHSGARQSRHVGFDKINYSEGVSDDGRI